MRAAIAATDLNTVMGHVTYGEDNGGVLPCVGCQWVLQDDGTLKQEIVSNGDPSNGITPTAEMKTSGFAWQEVKKRNLTSGEIGFCFPNVRGAGAVPAPRSVFWRTPR